MKLNHLNCLDLSIFSALECRNVRIHTSKMCLVAVLRINIVQLQNRTYYRLYYGRAYTIGSRMVKSFDFPSECIKMLVARFVFIRGHQYRYTYNGNASKESVKNIK